MTEEQLVALLPFVLILIVGLVLGGLIGGVISSTVQNQGQNTKSSPNRNIGHIAGLWRDKRNGRLSIEIENKYYASIDRLPSRQVSALLQASNDFQTWLGVENLSNRLESIKPKLTGSNSQPREFEQVEIVDDQLTDLAVEDVVEPVKVSVSEIVTGAILPKSKTKSKVQEKPKSIVEQVDAILQIRLAKSIYNARVIRLLDAPSGGVEVLVDGNRYDGVDSVPDLAVRTFIQECVKEWEKGK
jgi:hypothetical protein